MSVQIFGNLFLTLPDSRFASFVCLDASVKRAQTDFFPIVTLHFLMYYFLKNYLPRVWLLSHIESLYISLIFNFCVTTLFEKKASHMHVR